MFPTVLASSTEDKFYHCSSVLAKNKRTALMLADSSMLTSDARRDHLISLRGMSKTVKEEIHAIWRCGKNHNWCGKFREESADKCIDYAENTLNYVEMLTVNKIDKKAFPVYEQHWKEKNSNILPTA